MILKEGNAKSVEIKKKFSSMSLKYVSYEILANKNVNKSTKPEKNMDDFILISLTEGLLCLRVWLAITLQKCQKTSSVQTWGKNTPQISTV